MSILITLKFHLLIQLGNDFTYVMKTKLSSAKAWPDLNIFFIVRRPCILLIYDCELRHFVKWNPVLVLHTIRTERVIVLTRLHKHRSESTGGRHIVSPMKCTCDFAAFCIVVATRVSVFIDSCPCFSTLLLHCTTEITGGFVQYR